MEEKKPKKPHKPKEKLYGNRIRILLKEKGLSQQELADLSFPYLKDGAAYLSRIINGERRCISLPIAIRISQALKEPVENVFIFKKDN